ncbi:MAG: tetratricopeptide repeat protein [Nitrospinales bacterium]
MPAKKFSAMLILAGLAFLGYLGTLHSPFLYDDAHAIVHNPHIQELEKFQETVGIGNILNRSFVLLTYALNRELGRLDVFGYHLFNLALHVFVGIVLFFLTAELLRLEPPERRGRLQNLPLLVSVIHVFNPMAVESVTYLSSRSSLLATLFFLLSFYYWVRFLGPDAEVRLSKENFYCLLLIGGFFFLGCASKETIVTMPLMGVVYLWLKSPGLPTGKSRTAGIFILLPLVLYLAYRTAMTGNPFALPADSSSHTMDRVLYLFTQAGVMVFYYGLKLLLPVNLNFEPDLKMVSGAADPVFLAAVGVILLIGWYGWRQESRLVRFALIWMLVTVLPTSSFIPLKQLAAEHRAYLPGLGLNILVGVWFLNCAHRTSWIKPLALCFLVLMSTLTVFRGLDYRTAVSLWRDTAKKSPGKALVHNNLATVLIDENLYDRASKAIETALSLDPQFTLALNNQGHMYFKMGRFEQAREVFDKLIFFGAQDANTYYNAGMARVRLGQTREALPFFQKAVAIDPDSAAFRFSLGNAYKKEKLYDRALKEFKLALKYQPNYPDAINNIGVIFWELKSFELAAAEFRRVLAIQKNHMGATKNLASVYMLLGKYREAIPYIRRSIAHDPEDANARGLLHIAETLQHEEPPG